MSRFEVKACGVRDPSEVFTLEALMDATRPIQFIGVNLVPSSPRYVDAGTARAIVGAARSAVPVGVFRDVSPAQVADAAGAAGMGWVQLHGAEPAEDVAVLARHFAVIKALTPAMLANADALIAYRDAGVTRFLLDGPRPGTGERLALRRVHLVAGKLVGVRCWLAGGLHTDNVRAALTAICALGADAATGVERDGAFSPERAVAFAIAAHGAAHALLGAADSGTYAADAFEEPT